MDQGTILFAVKDHVATITLNRPKMLNSIDKQMAHELISALRTAARNPDIRSVLITGNGRGFCSGQDLNEFSDDEDLKKEPHKFDLGSILETRYIPIVRLIRETEKPFVCAVNGIAAGAGANIALACDFVIASDQAWFTQAFAKVGLIPDSGGTFFLPRLVGFSRATELMMLGEKVTAKQAVSLNMIYKCYSHKTFLKEAEQLAQRLGKQATIALGLIKRALNRSLGSDFNGQLNFECDLQRMAGHSSDFAEGIVAFVGKRTAKFTGQ